MKNTIFTIFLASVIFATAQEPIYQSEEERIFAEYGLTPEQYVQLTNRIESAIIQLINSEVRYLPADSAKRVEFEVKKILSANLATMSTVQVQAMLTQATVNKTELEVVSIYAGTLIHATEIQIPTLVAAILAQATEIQIVSAIGVIVDGGNVVQIQAITKALLAQATEVQVSSIMAASFATHSSLQVEAIVSAMFATKTEVEIKRIMAATYVSKTGISMLDYLDRAGFHWIIMRMKMAKSAGNEELYQELQRQLILSVNDWVMDDNTPPQINDPEVE